MSMIGLYKTATVSQTHRFTGFMLPLYGGIAAPARPSVVYALATDSDTVVVIFSSRMNQLDLADIGSYTIDEDVGSDPRTVTSVVVTSPRIVTLTLDDRLTQGTNNYMVTVTDVRDERGSPIDTNANFFDFSGPAIPQVVLAAAVDSSHVLVVFSTAVGDPSDPGDYVITEDVGSDARVVTAVVVDPSNSVVTLTLDGNLSEGTDNYNVEVTNPEIDPADNDDDFSGPTASIGILSVAAQDSVTVRITFNAPVLDNNALRCRENYHVVRDSDSAVLTVLDLIPEAVTNPTYIDLTVNEQQDGELYDVTIDLLERA